MHVLTAGTVVDFDDHRGAGTVRGNDGRQFDFHCTAIIGGSRRIEQGTPVVFIVVAGHHGQWEAAEVSPLPEVREP